MDTQTKKSEHRARFESIASLADDEIHLDEAALVIAAESQPDVDIDVSLHCLDTLATKFETFFDPTTGFGVSVASLIDYIHSAEGFGGNMNNYYDPQNIYLNRVLETRSGIPISLALVHISLGERLDLPVKGINFPNHFLVRYGEKPHQLIVDPFSGRILSEPDCATLLKQIAGPKAKLQQQYFDVANNKDILLRILDNLKTIFWQKSAWDQSKACIERQIILRPEHEKFSVQLGAVYEMQGNFQLAQVIYRDFLRESQDEHLRNMASNRLLAMHSNTQTIH